MICSDGFDVAGDDSPRHSRSPWHLFVLVLVLELVLENLGFLQIDRRRLNTLGSAQQELRPTNFA
jgi:hypothetical protein